MKKNRKVIKGWVIIGKDYWGKNMYFCNDTDIYAFTSSQFRAHIFGTRKQAINKIDELGLFKDKYSNWHVQMLHKQWVICSKELPKVYFIDKKDGFHFTTNLDDAMLFETEALALQTLYSFGSLSSCNHWKIEWV